MQGHERIQARHPAGPDRLRDAVEHELQRLDLRLPGKHQPHTNRAVPRPTASSEGSSASSWRWSFSLGTRRSVVKGRRGARRGVVKGRRGANVAPRERRTGQRRSPEAGRHRRVLARDPGPPPAPARRAGGRRADHRPAPRRALGISLVRRRRGPDPAAGVGQRRVPGARRCTAPRRGCRLSACRSSPGWPTAWRWSIAQISIGDPVVVAPGVYIVHGQFVADGLVEIGHGAVIAPLSPSGCAPGTCAGRRSRTTSASAPAPR